MKRAPLFVERMARDCQLEPPVAEAPEPLDRRSLAYMLIASLGCLGYAASWLLGDRDILDATLLVVIGLALWLVSTPEEAPDLDADPEYRRHG